MLTNSWIGLDMQEDNVDACMDGRKWVAWRVLTIWKIHLLHYDTPI